MNYDISGLTHARDSIRSCSESDIEDHYSVVQPLVKYTDEAAYVALMLQAVSEGTAYAVLDNSCFLYYLKDEKYSANGICFYGTGNPVGMITLFAGIFDQPNEHTKVLKMTPHSDGEIQHYKSLLVVGSIIKWRRHGLPVVIRVDKLMDKIKRLMP